LAEGRRILTSDGIGVVVFAHKSTDGWETMIEAMLQAMHLFASGQARR
jgi:adenine-specific DNA methylase